MKGPPSILSIDGNFGLVRRKAAGTDIEGGGQVDYFVEQETVDKFVQAYPSKKTKAGAHVCKFCFMLTLNSVFSLTLLICFISIYYNAEEILNPSLYYDQIFG